MTKPTLRRGYTALPAAMSQCFTPYSVQFLQIFKKITITLSFFTNYCYYLKSFTIFAKNE